MASQIVEEYGDERAAEALQKGIAQGIQQKAMETAKKMLVKNYSESDISEITGLPLDQVIELKKHLPAHA